MDQLARRVVRPRFGPIRRNSLTRIGAPRRTPPTDPTGLGIGSVARAEPVSPGKAPCRSSACSRRLPNSAVLKIRVSGVQFPPWPPSNSMNPDGFAYGTRTIGPRVGRNWGGRHNGRGGAAAGTLIGRTLPRIGAELGDQVTAPATVRQCRSPSRRQGRSRSHRR